MSFDSTYKELKLRNNGYISIYIFRPFDSTYKELKHYIPGFPTCDCIDAFDSTYKELKHLERVVDEVVSYAFDSTYKELKPVSPSFIPSSTSASFWLYL